MTTQVPFGFPAMAESVRRQIGRLLAMACNAPGTPNHLMLTELRPRLNFPALKTDQDPTIFVVSEVRLPPPPPKPPDFIPPHLTLVSSPFNQPAKSCRPMRRCPAAALFFGLNQIRFWSNPRTSPSKFFNLAVCPLSLQVVNLAPQFSIRSKILWIMFYGFLGIVLSGCVIWFAVLEIGDGMIRGRHKARRWFWAPGWHEGQVLSSGSFMIKIWDPGECFGSVFSLFVSSLLEWGFSHDFSLTLGISNQPDPFSLLAGVAATWIN